ncbi:MAG TPA: EF-Tu/IF-2/RF-3 family GTPase [Candidatus Saccharimonadales bacterium]|nr:EF-Tu/IF-2/RF-3 family GTPase [Candidatus Saccharimonadales bacterium]
MSSLVVALPNDLSLAGEIGKKGSQNGITFYDRKMGEEAIVVLTPSDVAAKFYAIGEIMSIADMVVISTASVDALLGESIIAASMLGKKTVFTKDNDISSILKSVAPKEYELVDRKEVLGRLMEFRRDASQSSGELRIDTDKAFPVKGVGTVILGIVRSGKVKVHDTLHSSSGKEILVRSIQVHDDDSQEAESGERVGLAVKGVDHTEMEKGDILSKDMKPYVSALTADIRKSPLARDVEMDGMNCTLISGFSVISCKVSKKESMFSVKLDKPTALWKNDGFILIRDKAPRVIAAGTVVELG